jgi:hypothetical protein
MPKKSIEELEQENTTLRGGLQELRGLVDEEKQVLRADGLIGLAKRAWGRPEFRLMLFVGCMAFWMWFNLDDPGPELQKERDIMAVLMTGFFWWTWIQQEYRTNGFIQLVMKSVLYFSGHNLAKNAYRTGHDLPWVVTIMLFFALLTISKLTQNIAAKVVELAHRACEIRAVAFFVGLLL